MLGARGDAGGITGLTVLEIDSDYMLGVRRDELNVQHVQILGLIRS